MKKVRFLIGKIGFAIFCWAVEMTQGEVITYIKKEYGETQS